MYIKYVYINIFVVQVNMPVISVSTIDFFRYLFFIFLYCILIALIWKQELRWILVVKTTTMIELIDFLVRFMRLE